ncbi:MAG TPA: TetR/AcrR family transcriptional regulator, partial [Deltaproteobacteria bacterium]|nr:TetR/AcrR family transcriptional regulator [Deltaproteobacteria bacterium]
MPTKRFRGLEEERQQQLLVAAAAEFSAHGYQAASFNRIIERAGVSKGAMYYYFEDKADLYATVVRDAVARLVEVSTPVGEATDPASFWLEIREMVRATLEQYRIDPYLAGLVRSLTRDGLPVAPVEEIRAMSSVWFTQMMQLGQSLGAVRHDLPVDLMLAIAIGASEGFDVWLADRIGELTDEALDELAETVT